MRLTIVLLATAILAAVSWMAWRPRPDLRAPLAAPIPTRTPSDGESLPGDEAPVPIAKAPAASKPQPPAAEVMPGDRGERPVAKPTLPEGHPITVLLRDTKVSLDLQQGTWSELVEKLQLDVRVPVALDPSIAADQALTIKVQDISVAGVLTLVTASLGAEWTVVDQSVVIRKRNQE